MIKYLAAYCFILIIYIILDALWLGVVSKESYTNSIGQLMRDNVHIWPWFAFYLSYSLAILYLVLMPNINNTGNYSSVIIGGAILGFAAYGAYNFTNYAILKDWPIGITIKDLLWGTSVTTMSAVGSFYLVKRFFS